MSLSIPKHSRGLSTGGPPDCEVHKVTMHDVSDGTNPAEVSIDSADPDFPVVRKGYEPAAVHAYLDNLFVPVDESARIEADRILEEARATAITLVLQAEETAAARLVSAEEQVLQRTNEVLDGAKARLRRLLDSEREVHSRLSAAFSNLDSETFGVLASDDDSSLDRAFTEYFTAEFEHDASRAWILSDQPG